MSELKKRRLVSFVFGFFSNTIALMLIAVVLAVTAWGYFRMKDFLQYGEDFINDCQTTQVAQLEASRALAIAEMEAHSRKDLEFRLKRTAEICLRLKFQADDAIMKAEAITIVAETLVTHIIALNLYIAENKLPTPALPQIKLPALQKNPFILFEEKDTCPDENSSNSPKLTIQLPNEYPISPDGLYPRSSMGLDAFGMEGFPEVFLLTPFLGLVL